MGCFLKSSPDGGFDEGGVRFMLTWDGDGEEDASVAAELLLGLDHMSSFLYRPYRVGNREAGVAYVEAGEHVRLVSQHAHALSF
mmetsp:Transcript_12356/g.25206  ORF Transcript_12356/g.25206 Transcript_12356/m.25206 type:complete len:84 (+) Transcript_12356:119-370(+)